MVLKYGSIEKVIEELNKIFNLPLSGKKILRKIVRGRHYRMARNNINKGHKKVRNKNRYR